MRNIKSQGGFTIIELMIVVMVIGVLAAITLPSIRQYAVRAKVSEVMLAIAHCTTVISEVYQTADVSQGADTFGCESSDPVSQYVSAVHTTVNGTIKVTVDNIDLRVNNNEVTMAPLDFQGNPAIVGESKIAQWRCGNGPIDGTSLPPTYLPGSCK